MRHLWQHFDAVMRVKACNSIYAASSPGLESTTAAYVLVLASGSTLIDEIADT